jgi:hypothetical protein
MYEVFQILSFGSRFGVTDMNDDEKFEHEKNLNNGEKEYAAFFLVGKRYPTY